jgi:phosphatidate phosphatase APP1
LAVAGLAFVLALSAQAQFMPLRPDEVFLVEKAGVSVISDIDDTIKMTNVRERPVMLRNTFLREFQPAPGMSEFCQTLARFKQATFHYISASPWQLYLPLAKFARANCLPPDVPSEGVSLE